MIFKRFQERAERERQAGTLYECIVRQAREPDLYTRYGVPDDLDGRFEMIALHTFLVLNRLKRGNPDAAHLAQALYDVFFRDMDDSLRQMGAGDLGVGKKVKRMAEAFSGNLYGTLDHVERDVLSAMARYMRGQCDRLARQDLEDMTASGEIDFMDPKACP
jgi:cytochrome b pre-mRNA-processing protein 3